MSGPKRYWISDHGMAESECGAWVHYDDWLKLEEARFALEFRLELATKRNAELHALHETVVRERDGLARDCDGLRAELNFARDDIRELATVRDELRALLDEAREELRFAREGFTAELDRMRVENEKLRIQLDEARGSIARMDKAGTASNDLYIKVSTERNELRALLTEVSSAYDRYRGRGVMPAPNEYAELVKAIERIPRAGGKS